jgi:hypothetical protein
VRYTYRYRSFFLPAVLILVGILALLVNTGQVPVDRLFQLLDLWPLILILIGADLVIRRTVHGTAGEVATAVILILAIVFAAAYVTVAPNPSATQAMDTKDDVGGLSEATVQIDTGGATVTITGSTELGTDLYHSHIDYSGPKPEVALDRETGRLRISQSNANFLTLRNRRFALNLQLNPAVQWSIEENSGASTNTIDVLQLHIAAITLNGGASRDEITLGPPTGIVPVSINGGSVTVRIHRPSGVAASVAVSGGAITLNADGRNMHGIGDLSYQSPGFGGAKDAYRIEVNGGACNVTLDSATPSG